MDRLPAVVLASLVSLSLSQVASEAASFQDDETLEWVDDYDEALALAQQTGKPLFLEFRCSP